MLGSILGLVIPLALRIVGLYLDKAEANKELKKQFFAFAEKMNKEHLNSVKLRDSFKRQLEKLKGA